MKVGIAEFGNGIIMDDGVTVSPAMVAVLGWMVQAQSSNGDDVDGAPDPAAYENQSGGIIDSMTMCWRRLN